jgi:1-hydroxycarotenoid 3,4-desaturase
MQRVVVIGAGVGGLAAAAEIAAAGLAVVLVETAASPGGKLREVRIGAQGLDAGPTVFTMRWVFDELFSRLGDRLGDHLHLTRATTLARHHWNGRTRLDLFADIDASTDAIGGFAGAAEAARFRRFCARARDIYQTLEAPFLRAARPGPLTLVRRAGVSGLPALARISPFQTLWGALEQDFSDPRLRQLFGRYATYCGSSPFHAPATLMLVAHVEQDGVWLVEGGMGRLAEAMAALATRCGAQLRFAAPVARVLVRDGRAAGVRLASGEEIAADAVVFNGDCAALPAGLMGAAVTGAVRPVPGATRSLSALTWNMVAPVRGTSLMRHNVFFSGDCQAEFAQLFDKARLPTDPTVYVCAQDRGATEGAPSDGAERLLCLVNAPACGDAPALAADALARCEQAAFGLLERCGLHIEGDRATWVRTAPADFAQRFPGTGGALYGRASHGWRASFARPGARSRLARLYLAGGSVHPGPGVPMAALSGRQAAASLLADLGALPPGARA